MNRGNALATNTYNYAQLGIPYKGCLIKGLVDCCIVWSGSMEGVGLGTCTRCLGLVPCCGQDGPIET